MDIANPLDFSQGMPPSLNPVNTDSLGEQIQRAFPEAKVVKTLNTMTATVMVDPARVAGGDHSVFVSGDDAGAKAAVTELLKGFGHRDVIDLGDITTCPRRGNDPADLAAALGRAGHRRVQLQDRALTPSPAKPAAGAVLGAQNGPAANWLGPGGGTSGGAAGVTLSETEFQQGVPAGNIPWEEVIGLTVSSAVYEPSRTLER